MLNKPEFLIIHHLGGTGNDPLADTSRQTIEEVNEWHKNARMPDGSFRYHDGHPSSLGYYLAYHYFIDKQGKTTQTRMDNENGNHTIGYNQKSIGIVLAGNFDAFYPTWEQRMALRSLLGRKIKQWDIKPEKVVPHRRFTQKSCYGANLSDSWARDLIIDSLPNQISFLRYLIIHLQDRIAKMKNAKIKFGFGEKECGGLSVNF